MAMNLSQKAQRGVSTKNPLNYTQCSFDNQSNEVLRRIFEFVDFSTFLFWQSSCKASYEVGKGSLFLSLWRRHAKTIPSFQEADLYGDASVFRCRVLAVGKQNLAWNTQRHTREAISYIEKFGGRADDVCLTKLPRRGVIMCFASDGLFLVDFTAVYGQNVQRMRIPRMPSWYFYDSSSLMRGGGVNLETGGESSFSLRCEGAGKGASIKGDIIRRAASDKIALRQKWKEWLKKRRDQQKIAAIKIVTVEDGRQGFYYVGSQQEILRRYLTRVSSSYSVSSKKDCKLTNELHDSREIKDAASTVPQEDLAPMVASSSSRHNKNKRNQDDIQNSSTRLSFQGSESGKNEDSHVRCGSKLSTPSHAHSKKEGADSSQTKIVSSSSSCGTSINKKEGISACPSNSPTFSSKKDTFSSPMSKPRKESKPSLTPSNFLCVAYSPIPVAASLLEDADSESLIVGDISPVAVLNFDCDSNSAIPAAYASFILPPGDTIACVDALLFNDDLLLRENPCSVATPPFHPEKPSLGGSVPFSRAKPQAATWSSRSRPPFLSFPHGRGDGIVSGVITVGTTHGEIFCSIPPKIYDLSDAAGGDMARGGICRKEGGIGAEIGENLRSNKDVSADVSASAASGNNESFTGRDNAESVSSGTCWKRRDADSAESTTPSSLRRGTFPNPQCFEAKNDVKFLGNEDRAKIANELNLRANGGLYYDYVGRVAPRGQAYSRGVVDHLRVICGAPWRAKRVDSSFEKMSRANYTGGNIRLNNSMSFEECESVFCDKQDAGFGVYSRKDDPVALYGNQWWLLAGVSNWGVRVFFYDSNSPLKGWHSVYSVEGGFTLCKLDVNSGILALCSCSWHVTFFSLKGLFLSEPERRCLKLERRSPFVTPSTGHQPRSLAVQFFHDPPFGREDCKVTGALSALIHLEEDKWALVVQKIIRLVHVTTTNGTGKDVLVRYSSVLNGHRCNIYRSAYDGIRRLVTVGLDEILIVWDTRFHRKLFQVSLIPEASVEDYSLNFSALGGRFRDIERGMDGTTLWQHSKKSSKKSASSRFLLKDVRRQTLHVGRDYIGAAFDAEATAEWEHGMEDSHIASSDELLGREEGGGEPSLDWENDREAVGDEIIEWNEELDAGVDRDLAENSASPSTFEADRDETAVNTESVEKASDSRQKRGLFSQVLASQSLLCQSQSNASSGESQYRGFRDISDSHDDGLLANRNAATLSGSSGSNHYDSHGGSSGDGSPCLYFVPPPLPSPEIKETAWFDSSVVSRRQANAVENSEAVDALFLGATRAEKSSWPCASFRLPEATLFPSNTPPRSPPSRVLLGSSSGCAEAKGESAGLSSAPREVLKLEDDVNFPALGSIGGGLFNHSKSRLSRGSDDLLAGNNSSNSTPTYSEIAMRGSTDCGRGTPKTFITGGNKQAGKISSRSDASASPGKENRMNSRSKSEKKETLDGHHLGETAPCSSSESFLLKKVEFGPLIPSQEPCSHTSIKLEKTRGTEESECVSSSPKSGPANSNAVCASTGQVTSPGSLPASPAERDSSPLSRSIRVESSSCLSASHHQESSPSLNYNSARSPSLLCFSSDSPPMDEVARPANSVFSSLFSESPPPLNSSPGVSLLGEASMGSDNDLEEEGAGLTRSLFHESGITMPEYYMYQGEWDAISSLIMEGNRGEGGISSFEDFYIQQLRAWNSLKEGGSPFSTQSRLKSRFPATSCSTGLKSEKARLNGRGGGRRARKNGEAEGLEFGNRMSGLLLQTSGSFALDRTRNYNRQGGGVWRVCISNKHLAVLYKEPKAWQIWSFD